MVNLVYIKLKNFEALPICMDRDEIEIDRSDSPNNLVIIKGRNASGKSTLLQELTPFPIENTLSRNSRRIIKGKEGLKELHFLVDNRYLYKCRIIYQDKKTSAYISKSDLLEQPEPFEEELNPNGNISSYEEILETEMGLKKSYQKIGYLSPDIINFISMKAAERAHYVSSIMPDISIYLKGYEIANKKANEKEREIDNINKELGKLSSINYETHLNELKDKINNLNISLDTTKNNITKCEVYINNLEKYSYYFDKLDDLMNQNDILHHQLDNEKNRIKTTAELISKYQNSDGNERLKKDLININKEIEKNREKVYLLEDSVEKLNISIRDKMTLVDNSDIKESYNEIVEFIDRYENELKELDNIYKDSKENNSKLIELFQNMETNHIYEFSRMMDFIIDYSNKIEDQRYDYDAISAELTILENQYKEIIDKISNLDKDIESITEKISLLKSNEEMVELYNLKPMACTAAACKIIQQLEKIVSESNEKDLMITNKELMISNKENNEKSKELIENKMFSINQTLKILVSINDFINNNSLNIVNFSEELKNLFKLDLKTVIEKLKSIKQDFNSYKEFIHIKDKIKVLQNSLNELKIKKTTLINKNNLQKEIEELDNKNKLIAELKILIYNQTNEKDSLEKISETKEKLDEDIKNYNKNIELLKIHANNLASYSKIKYYYSHLKDIYVKLQCDKSVKERDKEDLEKERELLKTEFINKQQLEKLRSDLMKLNLKYSTLAKIWNPRIGYPSLIIKSFLRRLKDETNQDLAEIWDNSLSIESFDISKTEFSIVMNKNGAIIPDASQCSQGEKAILSLALSFAIIELGLDERKYNIVRMDEADGPLDTVRARYFLSMLQTRLKKMDNAIAFIITHKDEFDEVPADLILLKNADLSSFNNESMHNKNIIFKL